MLHITKIQQHFQRLPILPCAICWLWIGQCSQRGKGRGRLPNKCRRHNLGLPLIGGVIFRRALCPQSTTEEGRNCFCCPWKRHIKWSCPMMSRCFHASPETRVSGSEAPQSIKAAAKTCYPGYWITRDGGGGTSRSLPLAAILGWL